MLSYTHTHVRKTAHAQATQKWWWLELLITIWTNMISMYFLHRIRAHIHGEVS